MELQQAGVAERWERWEQRTMNLLPFGLLALCAGFAIGIDSGSTHKVLIDGVGSLLAAVWMLWMLSMQSEWPERPRLMRLAFAVLALLSATLVVNNPVYGFFSWTGYLWTFRILEGRWRFVGVGSTALITGISQHGGVPSSSLGSWVSLVAIVLVNFVIAGAIGWFSWIRDEQTESRKQAITELTEANAKLEAALRENAGLHAQLLSQAREAGVLDERQRIAREIHDTLAQGLVGIITQLEAAERCASVNGEFRRHREAAMQLARDSLAEARRSVQALSPTPLDQARLPEAIASIATKWSALSGIEASVTTTGAARPMRPEIETALLRTAQEALANIAKHARAGRVVVTLSYMEDVVGIDVRDDGVGFALSVPSAPVAGGFGLTAMRQRVQGLAGTLEIESEPGEGTIVSACIPAIPVGSPA